ncbi:hypothetical protein, partial [Thiolapillus sp.]|uniref:hypothetical protein n=1 Tax=Thiolapillus sp. TaxID=2017437 RepID=UPI0025DFF257
SEHNPLEINHFWSFCLIRASRVESREPSTLNSVEPRIILSTENVLAVNMPAVNKLVAGTGEFTCETQSKDDKGLCDKSLVLR